MAHVPVKELVARCRALARECTKRGISEPERYVAPTIADPFAYEMGGKLAGLADNIESLSTTV
jgi:hypothetical protein